MTKPELLRLMRLLSALESWTWATQNRIPPELSESVSESVQALEREILQPVAEWPEPKGPRA